MLVDLRAEDISKSRLGGLDYAAVILTVFSFVGLAGMLAFADEPMSMNGGLSPEIIEAAGGNTYVVGMTLFSKYLWPFELASVLILLAIVASIVIVIMIPESGDLIFSVMTLFNTLC